MISAIAYELIPESTLAGSGMAFAFGLGAIAFFAGDWLIDHQGGGKRKAIASGQVTGSGAAIFIGTLLDAMMPEAFEHGGKLVGLFIVFGVLAAAVLSFID